MKPKLSVIISAAALLVLVLVQVYNISETFRTKQEQFDIQYGNLVRQALYEYESGLSPYTTDSVFFAFDLYAEELLNQMDALRSEMDADTLNDRILSIFNRILKQQRKPDEFLREYLAEQGADNDFRSGYFISELYLLDFNRVIPVFIDSVGQGPGGLAQALHADSHAAEGNFFRIRYDYYVDFTHKTRIIYREMIITMALAVLTILIVLLVFTLTLRNMMIQKRLSDLKTDFINNMTHELKTPLSTIAVASSTLSDEAMLQDRTKVRQISEMIRKQNKHLTRLIDRILDISIWEKDQVRLKPVSVHIYEFMEERIKLFRLENGNREVDLEVDYQLDKDYVKLDEVHMTTVLNNLLSNAVKYCRARPRIRIRVHLNDRLRIRIEDNGIGIKKEDQKHVFEKFYRAGKGDFRASRGLGLGLYYVKQIVTAHGGEIELSSIPGKGSIFIIDIPANHEHPAG